MSKTFHSLQFPNYRLWFTSNFFSATAMWVQRVAQIWIVLTILTDNSAIAVGIVTALQFAPQIFLGPLGGVLADRGNRRRVIQIGQIIIATLSLILGILVVTEAAQLWHVYLLALIAGTSDALTSATRNTFVSELVPPESLPNAISLNSTAFNIARLIGPATAGVMIDWFGAGWVLIVDFALFFIPVATLAVMRAKNFFPFTAVPRHKGMIREGFAYIKKRTDIQGILILVGVISGLGFNFQMTQALMATQVFGRSAGDYGLLGSALAIGSLSGALLAARRAAPRFSYILFAGFVFGFMSIGAAFASNYWVFALLMVPCGFLMLTFLIGCNTLIQTSVPPELRGRALAIYFAINLGTTPVGAILVGWVGEHFGARWSLAIGGIAALIISLIVFVWTKSHWDVELHRSRHWPFVSINGPRERAHLTDQEKADLAAQRVRRGDEHATES
ncbi:MFS family permease [Arcanobacterium wilhelmae]|uniref:MFS family permease n=1 Tax=Arcanobacterium wilhelmae TaxID=1803177 RepID=A0ABT9NAX0_9ACTO|nr:MFS transporter [Arcanobacterium wilhelmae]MDP9800872.1 MFS family permease [Arcanobacterium wilhelmae]WFN90239.1 MFS transporter [Arcanobacterium wilhelmae]